MSLNSNLEDDTIVAISTPPGRGGIGIVRLSGPAACTIAEPLLKLRHPLAPAHARFAEVLGETGEHRFRTAHHLVPIAVDPAGESLQPLADVTDMR